MEFFFCSVFENNIFFKSCLIVEREPELMPKCLFSSSSLRRAPPAWDAPGLGLTRIFLGTELHVWGLPPRGKRVGGSSTRAVPRTPLLFHRLKLMSCVCTLLPLSLFCLLSPDQAHPALPRNPKAKCFRVGLVWHILVLSLSVSPTSRKGGEHPLMATA